MVGLREPHLPDDRDERTAIYDLERELRSWLPGPVSTQMNGWASEHTQIWLARSWIQEIHRAVRQGQGDTQGDPEVRRWDTHRVLAAICARTSLDYEAVLEAEPVVEMELILQMLEDELGDKEWPRRVG